METLLTYLVDNNYCNEGSECITKAIKWWEIGNMVLYTPVALFGLGLTLAYATDYLPFGDGAGLGIAMIIDIAMGFYHSIYTSTGLFITSYMKMSGKNKVFYTTGRLTSEMVIKVAQMAVPLLLSRSGATEMGLQIAQQTGIGLVARAKGKHFLVFNGFEYFRK